MAKIHLPCTHRGSAAPPFQLSGFFGFDAGFTLGLCGLFHLGTLGHILGSLFDSKIIRFEPGVLHMTAVDFPCLVALLAPSHQ